VTWTSGQGGSTASSRPAWPGGAAQREKQLSYKARKSTSRSDRDHDDLDVGLGEKTTSQIWAQGGKPLRTLLAPGAYQLPVERVRGDSNITWGDKRRKRQGKAARNCYEGLGVGWGF